MRQKTVTKKLLKSSKKVFAKCVVHYKVRLVLQSATEVYCKVYSNYNM